ncbi:MAG: outer membrane protein assembly factor BamD [Proteobacteria bacterium]|nr:outer membrane protein assembly factor BamD [Pseudomonadota bacterium]MCL2308492.1 outer membrane protein assembly factor BamD [Pseudomonadota bacterium]
MLLQMSLLSNVYRPAVATLTTTFKALALALVFTLALTGCKSVTVQSETAGWSAERIYQTARDAMNDGNYARAIQLYENLEARYPYGRYAQQAILESAYANYRSSETQAAIAQCDRFIRMYPNHPSADYAYYLKGLVYFREDQGLLGYLYELDLSERDPRSTRESFDAFKALVEKFPDSRYAEDSTTRMVYLSNAMGMYEVHTARYYFNRGAYLSAINRAQAALVNFPRTSSNEEALSLMIRSYEKLGMTDLANDTRRVLEASYPDSGWLTGNPNKKPWWKLW